MVTARESLRSLLRHDRWIMAAALALAVVGAGGFILAGGGTGMSAIAMTAATGPFGALIAEVPDVLRVEVWSLTYGVIIFVMWWLMMVAMMIPSAAPTVLLFGAIYPARGLWGMVEFLLGYLAIWAGMSLIATVVQAGLAASGMISPMYMTLGAPYLAAAMLILAGLYQVTPMKKACLSHCRGPVDALTRHRRDGPLVAFRMGAVHGMCCLGCCWALMALLFVGGVMNLWWIIGLMVLVALEKLAPDGERVARVVAVVLVAGGGVWLAALLGAAV